MSTKRIERFDSRRFPSAKNHWKTHPNPAKGKPPKGWRRVTKGPIKEGDLVVNSSGEVEWAEGWVGDHVTRHETYRKIVKRKPKTTEDLSFGCPVISPSNYVESPKSPITRLDIPAGFEEVKEDTIRVGDLRTRGNYTSGYVWCWLSVGDKMEARFTYYRHPKFVAKKA